MFISDKLLLMLQSVKRAHSIDPSHPRLHECLIKIHKKGKYCILYDPQVVGSNPSRASAKLP